MGLLIYVRTLLSGDMGPPSWAELVVAESNLLLKMALITSSTRNHFV